ncbi:MAG: GTP-binding protein, partial [Halobaculum sp.]
MSADRAPLKRAIQRGEEEGGNVEFKTKLVRDVHLGEGRMESLVAQLRHRVLSGDGEALYVVGVTDDGGIAGIAPDEFSETMDVLSLLAEEADAHIDDVETWSGGDGPAADDGLVGLVTIREGAMLDTDDEHIVVGTAGHVDHGKSTLVGSLVTGEADDG